MLEADPARDLDVRIVDPTGATVLPYILNMSTPSALATRGVNHTDTTEEVEIANALPGTYHVIVHGAIGDTKSTSQALTGSWKSSASADAPRAKMIQSLLK